MTNSMLVLLILFHFKHFMADFPLQTVYMLGKGKTGLVWIMPLAAHCAVHANLSALIILIFAPKMWFLALLEFVAHFIIDRLKCLYRLPAGPWDPAVKGMYLSRYYTAFGIDQMAHQLTYVLMAYFMS